MFEVVIFTQDNGFVSSLTNTGTVDPEQTVSSTLLCLPFMYIFTKLAIHVKVNPYFTELSS